MFPELSLQEIKTGRLSADAPSAVPGCGADSLRPPLGGPPCAVAPAAVCTTTADGHTRALSNDLVQHSTRGGVAEWCCRSDGARLLRYHRRRRADRRHRCSALPWTTMDRSEHSSRGARPLACTASATAALTHLRRAQLVSMLITEIQDLGGLGYLVFAGLMIFLQAQHSRSVTSPSSALCPPAPCHPPPPPPPPSRTV